VKRGEAQQILSRRGKKEGKFFGHPKKGERWSNTTTKNISKIKKRGLQGDGGEEPK